MDVINRLHLTIAALCPILGISNVIVGNSASVIIQFDPTATLSQKTAAQNILNSFDWSLSATTVWYDNQTPNRLSIKNQINVAITNLNNYIALTTPTQAQNNAILLNICIYMKIILNRLSDFN